MYSFFFKSKFANFTTFIEKTIYIYGTDIVDIVTTTYDESNDIFTAFQT